ncbi:MAG: YkgJ family cysteine cluster protein [Fibrobacterota bacterium]
MFAYFYNRMIIEGLAKLYHQLPEVPCEGCGECCVSPTCTAIEFTGAINYLIHNFTREQVEKILMASIVPHPAFEGNLRCCLQDAGTRRCLVHPARTLACRLFGLPAISNFKIENMENCRKIDFTRCGKADEADIRAWLSELTRLNGEVAPYYCEPYWIAGLNIECWLAVYFDPLLDPGAFGDLKRYLHASVDLSFMTDRYKDVTQLKDKVDRITLLYQLIEWGDREEALGLVHALRTAYPMTGTYYHAELSKIEALLNTPAV